MEHIVFVEATVTGAGLKGMQSAKERGMRISFLTRKRNSYCPKDPQDINLLNLADRVLDVDTNKIEDVCRAVDKLNKETPITALTTFADFYVPQAAAAAELLGLTTISYESAAKVRNKYLMRMALSQVDSSLNPIFSLVDSETEALKQAIQIGYPLVMKPQDENDGFDVVLISTPEELSYNFRRITSKSLNRVGQIKAYGGVILEEFIKGQEYSVETFQGGPHEQLQLIGVTRKYLTGSDRGCFVEIGHCFPVLEYQEQINTAVKTALNALEIYNAVCHTEVKVSQGNVKIVEINPRLAGGRIGSHLVEISTGLNPVDLVIDCARGLKPVWQGVAKCGAAIYNIQSPTYGKIQSHPNTTHFNHPQVVRYNLSLTVGQEVCLPLSNGDLVGQVITKAVDADTAFALAKCLAESTVLDII